MRDIALLVLLFLMSCTCSTVPDPEPEGIPLDGFVQLHMISGDGQFFRGSGVVVGVHQVLSAGHNCELENESNPHIFISRPDGVRLPAIIRAVDMESDLCMLYVEGVGGRIITLAKEPPVYGDHYFVVASPLDLTYVIHEGRYSGSYRDGEASVFTITSAPGSSGGGIINEDGELVGVISMVHLLMAEVSISPSYQQIQEFLDKHLL